MTQQTKTPAKLHPSILVIFKQTGDKYFDCDSNCELSWDYAYAISQNRWRKDMGAAPRAQRVPRTGF